MWACVWDKAASSWHNEKEVKRKSPRCFLFWDPSLVVLTAALTMFWVEHSLRFMLDILVALAQVVTSLPPLFLCLSCADTREKALCPEAVHAGWKWRCFFPSRSSLFQESCSWWSGPDPSSYRRCCLVGVRGHVATRMTAHWDATSAI